MTNESEYNPPEPDERPTTRFNSFVPLVLLGVSLVTALGWEVHVTNESRRNGERMREQQKQLVDQSRTVQGALEKIARDLIDLSQSDEDAKAIVKKYAISINNPAPAPASPSPSR